MSYGFIVISESYILLIYLVIYENFSGFCFVSLFIVLQFISSYFNRYEYNHVIVCWHTQVLHLTNGWQGSKIYVRVIEKML